MTLQTFVVPREGISLIFVVYSNTIVVLTTRRLTYWLVMEFGAHDYGTHRGTAGTMICKTNTTFTFGTMSVFKAN